MAKPFVRRPFSWILLVGLLSVVFAFSACGNSSSSTTTLAAIGSPTTASPTVAAAATITIREKTGGHDIYTFDSASVTIKAGEAVMFDNQSDEFHQLISTDAKGNPITNVDPFTANPVVPTSRESATTILLVTFKTPGTYYYSSKLVQRLKDKDHPEGALSQAKGIIIVK